MGRKWQGIRILFTATLVFVVGAIEDCIGGVQSEGLDWERVTNVGCQLKLWPFVSWQSTPSWPSNVVSVLIKRQRLHLIAYSGGGGGGGVGGRKILFSAHPPHFLFSFAAADMWWFVIKKQVKKPLRVFPELWTSNRNVALWHSENSLNSPFIFIVTRTFLKYRENIMARLMSTLFRLSQTAGNLKTP